MTSSSEGARSAARRLVAAGDAEVTTGSTVNQHPGTLRTPPPWETFAALSVLSSISPVPISADVQHTQGMVAPIGCRTGRPRGTEELDMNKAIAMHPNRTARIALAVGVSVLSAGCGSGAKRSQTPHTFAEVAFDSKNVVDPRPEAGSTCGSRSSPRCRLREGTTLVGNRQLPNKVVCRAARNRGAGAVEPVAGDLARAVELPIRVTSTGRTRRWGGHVRTLRRTTVSIGHSGGGSTAERVRRHRQTRTHVSGRRTPHHKPPQEPVSVDTGANRATRA